MIDPNLVAQNPDAVRHSLRRRHASPETLAGVEELVAIIARRRAAQTERDEKLAIRNRLSPQIGGLMKAGKAGEAEALKVEVRAASDRAAELDVEMVALQADEARLIRYLPNQVHEDTPEGKDEHGNVVVRAWGAETRQMSGRTHDDLAVALGMYDPERAAKLSGSRFYVLSGALAKMERALISLFCDMAEAHGYREVLVPYMVTAESMYGTGQLPKFEEDLFKLTVELSGQAAYLIPTAEVPVTNLHRDEIVDEAALPIRYFAFTPCFRSEAGSAGRDTRGLIRQHQFHKVELVWITKPEEGVTALEALTGHAQAVLERLGLPYQTVARCAGDVGNGGAKGYDLEVWLPGQQAYREISSCTLFTDYQARRLKLRFKREGEKKTTLCHTLNGSGLAAGRTLVAIIENYQQADGSIVVPEALRPYMGGLDCIRARV
ncbi:serine--tRNA ligase [Deltaproteobacteria bacterium]|nr:serine--tRNA ligase [Deltaproteobacteria bacterium]